MTRAHRSVGGHTEDHGAAWTASVPPVRAVERLPGADVGGLTVDELAALAAERQVEPSSLLGGSVSAEARADLDLADRLPDPVAALAVGVARLDPAAAAVLAGMIERFAAAERRRRPPAE